MIKLDSSDIEKEARPALKAFLGPALDLNIMNWLKGSLRSKAIILWLVTAFISIASVSYVSYMTTADMLREKAVQSLR